MEEKAVYTTGAERYTKPASFRHAVALMRAAQRTYFRTRGRGDLERSKHYEKVVDDWLKRHEEEQAERGGMTQMALDLGGVQVARVPLDGSEGSQEGQNGG